MSKGVKNKFYGFFIELAANDGLTQSNSGYFEFYKGYNGILIEPSVKGYSSCILNRPNSICINSACVSNDYKLDYVSGNFDNNSLMASIQNTRQNNKEKLVRVQAQTLEYILDNNISRNQEIDFLSLDVE